MNFLAHAYLSFNYPEIIAGNMISDFVKGKAQFSYPEGIQNGIRLHRQIDEYTDMHPATIAAKQLFRPYYRLYSGAIMDILYDHFLASDPTIFTETSLKEFTSSIYTSLEEQSAHLPPVFIQVFAYMRTDNWLFNYRFPEGIRKSLRGLARRSTYLRESDTAYNLFLEHYVELQKYYQAFFPDLASFAREKLNEILM
jgi:acyl carrier protein phosphodiesterase